MSTQQKALWLPEPGGVFEIGTKDVAKPGPGQLLVKVEAAALNPADWKVQAYKYEAMIPLQAYPLVLGSDAAGVVQEVGEGVTGWSKGDRVIHEGFIMNGTFQQYTIIDANLAAKIPSNISTEEAASIPLGLATAAIAMYNESGGLELTEPWTTEGKNKYAGKPFIVCAASTSVGQFVLQFAKLSGFSPIIATASPANFSLVKALGATHVVDRKLLGSLGEEVAKITTEPIQYAYDAWGDAKTQQALHDILAPRSRLVIVNPKQIEERDGKMLFQVFGYVQVEGNRKVGASLFGALEGLLSEGIIKPNPVEVLSGGLAGIVDGLEQMKEDKVSGKKLIVRPHETA